MAKIITIIKNQLGTPLKDKSITSSNNVTFFMIFIQWRTKNSTNESKSFKIEKKIKVGQFKVR